MSLRDLVYFDLNKTASLFSQLDDGLRTEFRQTDRIQGQTSGRAKLKAPLLAEVEGSIGADTYRDVMVTKALHHDLLNQLEAQLRKRNLLTDLTSPKYVSISDLDEARSSIVRMPYVIASGRCRILDFRRMTDLVGNFNDVGSFLGQINISEGTTYQETFKVVAELRSRLSTESDPKKRKTLQSQLTPIERQLEAMRSAVSTPLERWYLDGILLWIRLFMPESVVLSLAPSLNHPSFNIVAHLRRDCFVDGDIATTLHLYTSQPTVNLGVLGLITYVPENNSQEEEMPQNVDALPTNMARAFSGMFSAVEGLESHNRICDYPSIGIQPLAVFRHF